MLNIDTKAPLFESKDQDGKNYKLEQDLGKWILLYFYPKDDTPGCTKEACGLRDNYAKFQEKAVVIGVSADSVESHKKFAEKYNLPFILLADTDKKIIEQYEANGVFGKRISYLINPQGMIAKAYPKVDPSTHAEKILQDLQNLY